MPLLLDAVLRPRHASSSGQAGINPDNSLPPGPTDHPQLLKALLKPGHVGLHQPSGLSTGVRRESKTSRLKQHNGLAIEPQDADFGKFPLMRHPKEFAIVDKAWEAIERCQNNNEFKRIQPIFCILKSSDISFSF